MKIKNKHAVILGIAAVFCIAAAVLGISLTGKSATKEEKVSEDKVLTTDVFAGSGSFLRNGEITEAKLKGDVSDVSISIGSATVAQATVETVEVPVVTATEEATEEAAVVEENNLGEWNNKVMAKVENEANIRATAAPEGELVGHLPKGAAADIIERAGDWTKISSGSVTGYVKNEFLAFDAEAKQMADALGKKATVNTETLRIRSAADENAEIIKLASTGDAYGVISEDVSWVAVSVDDKTGYMAAEFVTVSYNLGKATSIQEEQEAARKAAEEKARKEAEEEAKKAKKAQQKAEEEAKNVQVETTMRESVPASVDDVTLLGALIQVEAGGQSYECQLAVASTIVNRLNSPNYPNTISGIVYQKGQYPPAHNGKVARVLANGVRSSCLSIAQEALNGKNNIGHYLHFNMSSAVSKSRLSDYTIIDGECFY